MSTTPRGFITQFCRHIILQNKKLSISLKFADEFVQNMVFKTGTIYRTQHKQLQLWLKKPRKKSIVVFVLVYHNPSTTCHLIRVYTDFTDTVCGEVREKAHSQKRSTQTEPTFINILSLLFCKRYSRYYY